MNRTFLKIYPNSFLVRGHDVCLSSTNSSPMRQNVRRVGGQNVSGEQGISKSHDPTVSLKDRLSSVMKKVVADNSSRDNSLGYIPTSLPKAQVLSDLRNCESYLDDLARNSAVISVDVKGLNLGPEGKITSIHVSNCEGSVAILDILIVPGAIFQGHLKSILESESITKVMHDCRNVAATFWFQYQIDLKNVFDTQVSYIIYSI